MKMTEMKGPKRSARAFVFGNNGLLGSDLMAVLPEHGYEVTGADLPLVDITDPDSVRAQLQACRPDVVINAAAYTAVDRAEQEPEQAARVNDWGAEVVARETVACDARFVHFSTDYVFDGQRDGPPYTEDDEPHPQGVYGKTKLAGERSVLKVCPGAIVMRIGGLYGRNGKNFFSRLPTLLRDGVDLKLDGQRIVGPTWSGSVARQTCAVLRQGSPGLYHATCQGQTTWAEFGAEICKRIGVEAGFATVRSCELALSAPRPQYAVLQNQKLKAMGLDVMESWQEALANHLESVSFAPLHI